MSSPRTPKTPQPLDAVLNKIVEEVKKEIIALANAFDTSKAEVLGLRIIDANMISTRYCALIDADLSTIDGFAKYIECRILLRVANESKVTDFSDVSELRRKIIRRLRKILKRAGILK